MKQPLVTIVTPSFNQGRFIRPTIESVLSQDYPAIEYIVMDGGSTDETAAVVGDYASRLTWVSEKDRGQSHAINKGFRRGSGAIFAWINSDDLLLPGAVSRAVAELEKHPDAGGVYGDGFTIDRDGNTITRIPWTRPFDLWRLVNLEDYIIQQTCFFAREAIENVGYLREDLHYVMDWDLLIRIGKRFELRYIPEPMGCLREYPEAKSFSGGRQRIREIGALMKEHAGRKFTPGYIVYALHAYRAMWCDRVSWPLARRVVNFACGFAAGRIQAIAGRRRPPRTGKP